LHLQEFTKRSNELAIRRISLGFILRSVGVLKGV